MWSVAKWVCRRREQSRSDNVDSRSNLPWRPKFQSFFIPPATTLFHLHPHCLQLCPVLSVWRRDDRILSGSCYTGTRPFCPSVLSNATKIKEGKIEGGKCVCFYFSSIQHSLLFSADINIKRKVSEDVCSFAETFSILLIALLVLSSRFILLSVLYSRINSVATFNNLKFLTLATFSYYLRNTRILSVQFE